MFNQLLPQRIDNTYRGYKPALWLFVLVVLMKGAISLGSIFNGYDAASSADGIPLATFTPTAVQAVVTLFALLGLSHLMLPLMGLLVLVRYRAMVPLMFTLLLLEHLSRKLILHFMPIVRDGAPTGSIVSFVFIVMMIVGLALSLWSRDNVRAKE
jgi:hypothetical protein